MAIASRSAALIGRQIDTRLSRASGTIVTRATSPRLPISAATSVADRRTRAALASVEARRPAFSVVKVCCASS